MTKCNHKQGEDVKKFTEGKTVVLQPGGEKEKEERGAI
jgi:hypothetical protein